MLYDPIQSFVALAIPLGLLQCFFGYRMLMATLAITGFLLFGAFGAGLAQSLHASPVGAVFAGAIAGVIGSVAMLGIHHLGVFTLGMVTGALLGALALSRWPGPVSVTGAAISGVVGGVVALVNQRNVVIVITAILGAWLVTAGVLHFVAGMDLFGHAGGWARLPDYLRTAGLLGWMSLALCGLIVQRDRGAR